MELAVVQQQDSSEEPKLLPCTVPAAPGSRLDFSWGTGCQLHVAEVACPSTGAGGRQPYAGTCEWTSLSSAQRRVAYQALPIYTALQKNLLTSRGGMQEQARLTRQEYSDAVLDVLMVGHGNPAFEPPASEDDLQVAYEAALWHLLGFFFLEYDDLDRGAFPEAFAGWVLQHGSLFDADSPGFSRLHAQAEELLQDPRVDTNAAFWSTVHRTVLLGQLDVAMSLLAHHPVAQAGQDEGMAGLARGFDEVYQLLREVPRLARQSGSNSVMLCGGGLLTDDIVRFGEERAQWENRVSELYHYRNDLLEELMDADAAAAKGLAALLQMLCTEFNHSHPEQSAACKQMAKASWNWVELLTGMLLWQHKELPLIRLKDLVNAAVKIRGQPRHTDREFQDFFQELLVAACQQEVQEVILLTTNCSYTSLQFVAHSFEVMRGLPEANRVISRPLPHMGCDQAESFLLNYVEVLAGAASTWLLGAEYLAWCPVYGADALEAMLDTSPYLRADRQAAGQALALARRHDLTAAAYSLAKRLAAAAWQSGQMAAALQWALQAHDPQLCAELVAPLIAKVQQQLLAQTGTLQATPLELPELFDLEPLLLNLPDSSADGSADDSQQQQPRTQRYPELHFLRAMLQLQQALQEVRSCQQPMQQDQPTGVTGGSSRGRDVVLQGVSQQQVALLQAAYADLRQPVQQLLLEGLAPAAVRLPLLLFLAPVLESTYMPFGRAEVQGLLNLMRGSSAGLPSVAAAVLEGSHGSLPGVDWPSVAPNAPVVNAVRLALCRGLARAHVVEQGVHAW